MCSSALQPWKWQLIGIRYSNAVQASGAHCPRNGLWTHSYAARRTTPQSATLGLHPVIHVQTTGPTVCSQQAYYTPINHAKS